MKKDVAINEIVKQNEVFADIVNMGMYHGKKKIQAGDLKDLDPNYPGKRRDVLKEAVIKEDEKNKYVIFGIENQSEMDPTMPVRIMGYDVREYERQLRKKRDPKGLQKGEFLAGIRKGEKLKPVITIVLYESAKKWEGAKSLKEMVGEMGEGMEEVFNDYRINILEPRKIEEERCRGCRSEVGKILMILKYSEEKEKMLEYLRREENREVEEETTKVIEVITKIPMNVTQEGGKVDMCKATEEYAKECRKEAEIKTAQRMIADGFSDEMISRYVDLSSQIIQSVRKQMLVNA